MGQVLARSVSRAKLFLRLICFGTWKRREVHPSRAFHDTAGSSSRKGSPATSTSLSLQFNSTELNEQLVSRCFTLQAPYPTNRFLVNGHIETVAADLFRRQASVDYDREIIRLDDGSSLAIDWVVRTEQLPQQAPLLLLIAGLTGGSNATYVRLAAEAANRSGYRVVAYNHRGTAGTPLTTPQFYSACYTGDIREVVRHIKGRYPAAPLLAAAWSVGANLLVHYLNEEGMSAPLVGGVAMCNPFNLVVGDINWRVGIKRFYDWHLARRMRLMLQRHLHMFQGMGNGVDVAAALQARTVREFDKAITVPSFGWQSVEHYYEAASSAHVLEGVQVPLLCLQALNDPIAPANAIPYDAFQENSNLILATTATGGHLGWITASGSSPYGTAWTDAVMLEFLGALLELRGKQ